MVYGGVGIVVIRNVSVCEVKIYYQYAQCATGDLRSFTMSLSQTEFTKKGMSLPVIASSFVGVLAAIPLAFALSAPITATATQSGQSVTSQANVEDFAKFAYAFNQGYEASASSSTTNGSGAQTTCSEATVTVGSGQDSNGTTQVNMANPSAGKSGSTGSTDRTASLVNSYNTYTSMVNNSSTVHNVNSNNSVGSHNSTETTIDVSKSHGVMIGVSNDPEAEQANANNSFNEDSYNTKTDTSIINDSFNKEVTNTTTIDTDITKETTITKTEDSYNNDESTSHIDFNSHNQMTVQPPAFHHNEYDTQEVAV